MNFDKNNPDQEVFKITWWEHDNLAPHLKSGEQIVYSIKAVSYTHLTLPTKRIV